jgi:nucleoside-diphosphate-sugar epimerase
VGRHLTDTLARATETDVVGWYRDDRENGSWSGSGGIKLKECDILDADRVDHLIGVQRPTHTVHLAALSSTTQAADDTSRAWDVNFEGTVNVLKALRHFAPEGMFIFVSTAQVYGSPPSDNGVLDEDSGVQPVGPYARSKLAAEYVVTDLAPREMRLITVRPFNHTGPGQDERFLVPSVAAQIARSEQGLQDPAVLVGDLAPERDFLDVRDVVAAYCKIIYGSESLPGRATINVASDVARSVRSIVQELVQQATVPVSVHVDSSRLRPSVVPRICGNSTRARAMLDWTPVVPWTKTLADVLSEWRGKVARGA